MSFIQSVDNLIRMYDDFLVVRNYGELSAKFLLGTSMVIEKAGSLLYFLFLARTTIKIRLNSNHEVNAQSK